VWPLEEVVIFDPDGSGEPILFNLAELEAAGSGARTEQLTCQQNLLARRVLKTSHVILRRALPVSRRGDAEAREHFRT